MKPPAVTRDGPLQMLVTNLDYDEHKGRIAIGRVTSGIMQKAEAVVIGRPGAFYLPPWLSSHPLKPMLYLVWARALRGAHNACLYL